MGISVYKPSFCQRTGIRATVEKKVTLLGQVSNHLHVICHRKNFYMQTTKQQNALLQKTIESDLDYMGVVAQQMINI